MRNCLTPKNLKMCHPILVTLSQSSRENATPSSGTSPLASYEEVLPPPRRDRYPWVAVFYKFACWPGGLAAFLGNGSDSTLKTPETWKGCKCNRARTKTTCNLKWDHFEILERGRSDTKITETLLIRDLEPSLNENVFYKQILLPYVIFCLFN